MMPQMSMPLDVETNGEIRLYRMHLPFLPPSKNVVDNWPAMWKSGAKKKWVRTIAAQCDGLQIPKGLTRVGLAATLVFPTKQRRDPQNFAQTLWHWVPDALVECGVLLDDHVGCIEIGANWGLKFDYDLRPGVSKEKKKRTVLALTCQVKGD